ncbi:DUF6452 family protein [Hwangdonia lutea]|uniref:DUF6452 family protein n=1 Tax=Hwangdonia lutea TaxID=3075823 RepID=A0AA97HQ25_9FLAO|nr:DUF6452 family protein [Hwangdonia sp. SCSIO 19198]WOD43606.1 DUF6452 family protein [Hwangdonia sp. SCSIO 19198]
MKYFKYLFLPLLVIGITASCERDDICPESTSTTPSLIIDAFDVDNQEDVKNVFGLVVAGVGNNKVLSGYAITTTANLVLPLKTTEDTTQFVLINEATVNDNGTPNDTSDDFYDGNQDVITISYTREEVFVSRACGYKTIFKDVEVVIETDTDNWIQLIQSVNNPQSVEDETATHFNLFH